MLYPFMTLPDETGKQKKNSKQPWPVLIGYALIGAACGILIMSYLERLAGGGASKAGRILQAAFLFLCMYASMLIQIVIHEAGHLVFGLAAGYRFSSFRIFSLMWVKEDGRIRFKKLSLAGTGGQCLMCPPDLKDGKMPVMLYNLGGALLNVITGLLFGGLAFLCPAWSLGRVILMFMAVFGIALALINGLPLHAGPVNNDGRNALDLSRDPEAVRAFWTEMKANEMSSRGVRVKDMPPEWFYMPSDEAMKNGIIAVMGVLACSRLMDEKRFEEADRRMADILSGENGVVGLHRCLLTCDRIFIELIGQNRQDTLDELRSREQMKFMQSMSRYPSVLRTEYAYALLGEKDPEKAKTVLERFEKAAKDYPYPSEIRAERELIDLAACMAQ